MSSNIFSMAKSFVETFLTDIVMGSLWGLHSAKGVPLASTVGNPLGCPYTTLPVGLLPLQKAYSVLSRVISVITHSVISPV